MLGRATNQRGQILGLLRLAGRNGVTNLELNKICLRYGARIYELRRLGYRIATESLGDGVFKFILRGEPTAPCREDGSAPQQKKSETLSPFRSENLPLFAEVRQ